MQDIIERARLITTKFLNDTGVSCSVRGLVYNSTKRLWEPSSTVIYEGLMCSIASLASIRDPDIATIVAKMEISVTRYRMITCPFGLVDIKPDFRIVKEPVAGATDIYQVVEAVAPDETSPLELVLHCQKL